MSTVVGIVLRKKNDRNTNIKVIIESNDIDFHETKFPFKPRNYGGTKSSNIHMIRSNESNN